MLVFKKGFFSNLAIARVKGFSPCEYGLEWAVFPDGATPDNALDKLKSKARLMHLTSI